MFTLIGLLALGATGTTIFGATKAAKGEFEMDKSVRLFGYTFRVSMDSEDPLIFSCDKES